MKDIIILLLATIIGMIVYNIIIYITRKEDPEDSEKTISNYTLAYFLSFLSIVSFLFTVYLFLDTEFDIDNFSEDFNSTGLEGNIGKGEFSVRQFGKYFGYPDCCIDNYVKDMKLLRYIGNLNMINKKLRNDRICAMKKINSPYIPCHSHAYLINKGEITEPNILITRECPLSYEENIGNSGRD